MPQSRNTIFPCPSQKRVTPEKERCMNRQKKRQNETHRSVDLNCRTNWCLSNLRCHCEPVRFPGVAIPRLEGKCIDNCPTERETLRFLVVIVTWFLSTGGLPHQCAHWFAMTAFFGSHFQTPICPSAVREIQAETEPGNRASQRVLEKAGFRPNGITGAEGPRFTWIK